MLPISTTKCCVTSKIIQVDLGNRSVESPVDLVIFVSEGEGENEWVAVLSVLGFCLGLLFQVKDHLN